MSRRLGPPPPVRLADQLFLAAHDHDSGHLQARLHKAGLELGLAGALLAELVLERRIDVQHGRIVLVSRAPMDDILGQTVLGDIITELHVARQPHTVRVWLVYLRHSAVVQVRNRLCFSGILQEVPGRRWWGGAANTYRAADINQALGPEAAVYSLLVHEHATNTVPAMAFAALADASGLLPRLAWWREQRVPLRRRLARLRAELPPALRELADQTEAAIGDAVVGRP
ncbi:MAG TPA: GPP34 family phosphoprotein [Actinophytocola sp.]|uniref:GPP34 family phosphoprotein n=1 Tax=Actinophytocola sp. TaxID=1872138 RepID=UPI002DDCC539|nr:GPP34 family phosphoprotein [Actinophytocola sp.]HEV2781125.1 GPP34 family phosphoprotein [Actinophytocola sp.]